MITRSEILANRIKWIKFLKQPGRRKGRGKLDSGNGYRCCLGHACYALGIQSEKMGNGKYSYGVANSTELAPRELVNMVGLWDDNGSVGTDSEWDANFPNDSHFKHLTYLNDETEYTPKMIGVYLESVIEGGDNTVFRPLSDYPDD